LLDSRQRHVDLLDHAIAAGEKLCAMLSVEGHDVVRQQTAALQLEWDDLFTKVTASQRQLDVTLLEWTSYTDRVHQIEAWLAKMRTLLRNELPLVGTLEEKRTQLQTFKVLMHL